MSKYCPNCVTEMQIDNKVLGSVEKWYKCPSCGVREELVSPESEEEEAIKERQKTLRQKKRDERGLYDREGNSTY